MATVDSAVVPTEDAASDPVAPAEGAAAAKSKSKKGNVSKEKKPCAPPSHPPYAEVCSLFFLFFLSPGDFSVPS